MADYTNTPIPEAIEQTIEILQDYGLSKEKAKACARDIAFRYDLFPRLLEFEPEKVIN